MKLNLFIPCLVLISLVIWFIFIAFSYINIDKEFEVLNLRGAVSVIDIPQLSVKKVFDYLPNKPLPPVVDHLIMVPGHAAVKIEKLASADYNDESWYLLPYQRDQGFPHIITSHIRKSLDFAQTDSSSIIIFSGGQSRHDVGPVSEAASYYFLAEFKGWLNDKENSVKHSVSSIPLKDRVYLEEYARDSYENLLFSICRFYEIFQRYPSKITIIGFDFKHRRYTNLHRKAIYYPRNNFTYIDMVSAYPFNQEHAIEGEKVAYEEFKKDLYGCTDKQLHEKRMLRNPFKRSIPYELSCPDMKSLLEWCGPDLIDSSLVPWVTQRSL
jgi:hypothetical protein